MKVHFKYVWNIQALKKRALSFIFSFHMDRSLCMWCWWWQLTETLMLTYIQFFSCPGQFNIVTLSPTAWLISWVTDQFRDVLQTVTFPTIDQTEWEETQSDHKKTKTFPHTETKTKTLKIRNLSTIFKLSTSRDKICHCRHCRRQCKIFASSVNFSRNNAIYSIN